MQSNSNFKVRWADQQFSKSRVKREVDLINLVKNFNLDNISRQNKFNMIGNQNFKPASGRFIDPLWEKEWYMVS